MQGREPTGSTCDCSMFVRWAMAQAGIDVGLTTSTQWTANGRLPAGDSPQDTARRARRRPTRRGGYRPGDLVFFGVDDGPERARRPIARQRSHRPLLIERRRVQHSSPGRLCRADRLAQVEGGVRVGAENALSRSMTRSRARSSSTSRRSCMSWGAALRRRARRPCVRGHRSRRPRAGRRARAARGSRRGAGRRSRACRPARGRSSARRARS